MSTDTKDWPSLTEWFFGKGIDPAKYKGSMIPEYLQFNSDKKLNTSKAMMKKKAPKGAITKAKPKKVKAKAK